MREQPIQYVDEQTRKRLRRALGCHESKANVGRIMSVLTNAGLPYRVRGAAQLELTKRYMVAMSDAARDQLSGSVYRVVERLVYSIDNEGLLTLAAQSLANHFKRADVWVRLEVPKEAGQYAVAWLALALHYRQVVVEFKSVQSLAGAIQAKVKNAIAPTFKEALYGYGHAVWCGFTYPMEATKVFLPSNHAAYTSKYELEVRPFVAGCISCQHRKEPDGRLDDRVRCPGTDYPRYPEELEQLVAKHGCPMYAPTETAVRYLDN